MLIPRREVILGAIIVLVGIASSEGATLGKCKTEADCEKLDRDNLGLSCSDSNICVPKTLGTTCWTSAKCGTFTWCASGAQCRRGDAGAQCTTWRQCDLGLSCKDTVCVPGVEGESCFISYNCEKGLTCEQLKCVSGTAGKSCRTDFDCESNKCSLNFRNDFVSGFCANPPSPTPTRTPTPSPSSSTSPTPSESSSPTPISTPATIENNSPGVSPDSDASISPDDGLGGLGMDQRVCIGASSHVRGTTLRSLLRPTMRLQVHPLRLIFGESTTPIPMLCHEADGSRLCATARHVIQANGTLMYMRQFCASVGSCSIRYDVPLNFKAPCGEHIEFMPDVHATQHSGVMGIAARVVAAVECQLQLANRLWWTFTTL